MVHCVEHRLQFQEDLVHFHIINSLQDTLTGAVPLYPSSAVLLVGNTPCQILA